MMRLLASFIVLLALAASAHAAFVFQNGSGGGAFETKKPAPRPDLVIDLKTIDDRHLDVVMDRRAAIRFERRIGIGAPLDRFQRYIGKTRRQAIELVISELRGHRDSFRWPSWIDATIPVGFMEEGIKNSKINCSLGAYRDSLAAEWSNTIMRSTTPQFERLALLWLDHFSVAYDMYDRGHAFAEHLNIVRRHSNGNFVEFLKASLRDPGVIIYLNNETSTKDNPNENLAREFLELFSLGEGNYGEGDIRNLAKMIAGNGINFVTEEFADIKSKRTAMEQSAFGRSYDSIDGFFKLLVKHPAFGEFIARKFFNEFVALGEPTEREMAILVSRFRAASFDIPTLLEATLSLPRFWAEDNRLTLIKSPIDLMYGSARTLRAIRSGGNQLWLTQSINRLNQNLFNPPNIAGWPSGRDWIGGQLIEKRIEALKDVFEDLDTAVPRQMGGIKTDNKNQQEYNRGLDQFFASADPEQLAVETIVINWIPRDFGKRKYNDIDLSFYNVQFMGKRYDGISIEFGHDRNHRNRYGNYARVKQGFSSPDIFRTYSNGWQDDRDGSMVVKFSFPSGKETKRFSGKSSEEKLLVKRLMQSFKLLLEPNNQRQLTRSPGGREWMSAMLDEIGFEPVKGKPPVIQYVTSGSTMKPFGKFTCSAQKLGFDLRVMSAFEDDFFSFNDLKAEAAAMDLSLAELLIPDLDLPISDDQYMDILTYEGYQLK